MTEHQPADRPPLPVRHGDPAAALAGVSAPVQYGSRIAAIVVYLYAGQFLSRQRTAQALAELFATPLSEATVAAMTEWAAAGLGAFLADLRERIANAEIAGFDETGLRVADSCTGCTAPAPTSTR